MPGSLLVVRREGGRDALWRVTPALASATFVCGLPVPVCRAEPSPDGRRIAYIPGSVDGQAPLPDMVIVAADSGRTRLFFTQRAGARIVDSLTWMSPTRLLVAGARRYQGEPPVADRLATIDVTTGAASPFRVRLGAGPSAGGGRLVYTTFTAAGRDPTLKGSTQIRERLVLVDSEGSDAPGVIASGLLWGEFGGIDFFSHPRLSPDGAYLFSFATGHEAMIVDFELRSLPEGRLLFRYPGVGDTISAWDDRSRRVAFAGLVGGTPMNTGPRGVWVYDVGRGRLTRSNVRPWRVTNLSWSSAGDLVYTALNPYHPDRSVVYVAPAGDVRRSRMLMTGLLPVWVR